jgi:hypothetical protein
MAASYPGAIKVFSAVVNGVTKLVASLFNTPYDEITAIETELGTDPAGTKSDVKTRLAVSLNDDGTLKPQFGVWVDCLVASSHNNILAATDGFVLATGSSADISGYTDSSNPPTTLRCQAKNTASGDESFTMPVKKGHYWAVSGTCAICYWIPLGGS